VIRLIVAALLLLSIPAVFYWLLKGLLPWLDRFDKATCEEKSATPIPHMAERTSDESPQAMDWSSLEEAFREEFKSISYEEKSNEPSQRRFCFGMDRDWGTLEAYVSGDEIFISIGRLSHEHFSVDMERDLWDSKTPNRSAARKASQFVRDILEQHIVFAVRRKGTKVLSVSHDKRGARDGRAGRVIPLTGGCLTAWFSGLPCVIEERSWEPLRDGVAVDSNTSQRC